jgi:2-amino-4-hydroxy-6-hydroxymethyldihydropteridine diphosphokinase
MAECLLGLGSNLGDRAAQLSRACHLLASHPEIQGGQCSTFHATTPIGGPPGQAAFLNAALHLTTSLSPYQVLRVVRDIELRLGRQRRERWGPRAIDIDVLLYDQQIEDTDELVLPHPRMAVRRFVLAPAAEVAAGMVHPTTGWTMARLLQRLDETPHYVAIAGANRRATTRLARASARSAAARLLLDPSPPRRTARKGEPDTMARRELRAIAARLEQLVTLAGDPRAATSDWHVSNYWLPQSLAVARRWQDDAAREQVEQACARAIRQMPLPHCVVFLATTPDDAAASPDTLRGETPERQPPPIAYARQLQHQVSQPYQGPVLWMPHGDQRRALTELTAAIDAMR